MQGRTSDARLALTSILIATTGSSAQHQFDFSYTPGSAVGDERSRTGIGFEPTTTAGPHPLYIFLKGGGVELTPQSGTLEYARTMAREYGFVAVNVESDFRVTSWCSGAPATLEPVAQAVFGYKGAGDTMSMGLLATLCRRSNVDCSRGVAVHGFSMGGLLAALAPRYAPVVTATLVWGAGTSVSGDVSDGETRVDEGVTITAGAPLECVRDATLTPHLPRSQRRISIGDQDGYYGSSAHADGAYVQCQQSSGLMNCAATQRDCLQPDGSGYYVPDAQHELAVYDESHEPWGTQQSLSWLALTATSNSNAPRVPPTPPSPPASPSPPPRPCLNWCDVGPGTVWSERCGWPNCAGCSPCSPPEPLPPVASPHAAHKGVIVAHRPPSSPSPLAEDAGSPQRSPPSPGAAWLLAFGGVSVLIAMLAIYLACSRARESKAPSEGSGLLSPS